LFYLYFSFYLAKSVKMHLIYVAKNVNIYYIYLAKSVKMHLIYVAKKCNFGENYEKNCF